MKPGLYIITTPIGNIEDITYRAVKTLEKMDAVICEDTRITYKLLKYYNIDKPMMVYNDKSSEKDRVNIANKINQGMKLGLVSDAGTPLISDPGYKLLKYIKNENIFFDIMPGPSAPIAALTLSNFPTDKFYFGGFLPKTTIAKKNILEDLNTLDATLIFFESPSRLVGTLETLKELNREMDICIAREITKLYQEVKSGKAEHLIKHFQENTPKGEIVILLKNKTKDFILDDTSLNNEIEKCLLEGFTAKDIVNKLHINYKKLKSKSDLYKLVNKFTNDNE